MGKNYFDLILWGAALLVGFYTLTYARWLWSRKNKKGAVGVGILSLLAAGYPAIVLFFIHK